MPCLVEVNGQRFAISAGCLQAGVNRARAVLNEPGRELLKTSRGVGENFVAKFAVISHEGDVDLGFRDVDAERKKVHKRSSKWCRIACACAGQSCQCRLSQKGGGLRYRPACEHK